MTEIGSCEPCELRGEGVERFGTKTDLEIFYEDYKYARYPTFCSWEHAAEWFDRPLPDFETWEKSSDSDGFQYWGAIFLAIVLVLSVYGLVSLIVTIV